MFVRTLACSALAALVVAAVTPAARADFALVSQDLSLNAGTQAIDFALTFNAAPNFYAVAADGTPANSFQVEFSRAPDPAVGLPDDLTAVVRGDEIHTANAVRVRSPNGDGGAGSGGWGPVVGEVPFTVTGDTVAFSVAAKDLGWNGSGAWSANIISLDNGTLTAQRSVSSVPAPPAFWAGLAGLSAVAAWQWRQSLARRQAV